MQIIILGMHRSGTSLTTRLINMMGAYVGPEGMCGFNQDNPKGYWERRDVVECNVSLLKLHNPDWRALNVTPWVIDWKPPHQGPALPLQMKTIVFNMDSHRPWVMKDPYMCLTLPHWKPLLEVPVFVIVYRDPLEIAQSLRIRKYDTIPSLHRGMALWEAYAVSLLNASAGLPRIFVLHSDMMADPVNTTAQIYHAMVAQGVHGLRLPYAREINAYMNHSLYRAKTGAMDDDAPALNSFQQELAAMMRGERPVPENLAVSDASKTILEHHKMDTCS
ncbi:MAG: sulfotransferase [Pseudomonadota bacterium]|nr:sulfotransferase [Pseudomonadota bacterium]